MPVDHLPPSIVPSLATSDTVAEAGNPMVIPATILKGFRFTFLIRHPALSVPSLYNMTIPPRNKVTGYTKFCPNDLGYHELRRLFDFLRQDKQIAPVVASRHGNEKPADDDAMNITVIDTSDLLDQPEAILTTYCREVGLRYDASLLAWDSEEKYRDAKKFFFERYPGWNEEVVRSTGLKPVSNAFCYFSYSLFLHCVRERDVFL